MSRIIAFFRRLLSLPLRLIRAPFIGFARASAASAPTGVKPDSDEPYTMTFADFMENLRELRERVLKSILGLVIGSALGLFLAGPMLEFLKGPYCRVSPPDKGCELVILGPTGGVISYFRVTLTLGAIIAIPLITYQVLMFVLPGLTGKEKRLVLFSLPPVTVLFLTGVIFAWLVLIPPALGFLQGFQPTIFRPEWTADLYLSFVTALIFWMGVAFETPLVFFVLSLLGVVSAGALARNWRIAVVGASIAAAIITPTIDPVNMFLVMGPLLALYGLSIVLVAFGRRVSRVET